MSLDIRPKLSSASVMPEAHHGDCPLTVTSQCFISFGALQYKVTVLPANVAHLFSCLWPLHRGSCQCDGDTPGRGDLLLPVPGLHDQAAGGQVSCKEDEENEFLFTLLLCRSGNRSRSQVFIYGMNQQWQP